ncbi:transcription factor SPT20 homolog [Tenrec ecaudatus]|uniref:transcription factor SPT20 homolog n=1 Tax=Tenrec ecaudatus TaxID=94439 RepID=UPI003F5AA24F
MRRALEEDLGCMGALIESAQQRSPKRNCFHSERKSIFQKLHDLYVEEYEEEPESAHELRRNLKLVEKLVMREDLARLVVNLHPVNEGYSLVLMGEIGYESETIELPYEEGELLEYLDAAELPPVLVERLEKSQVNVFYSGCVFAEIRDYGLYRKMPTRAFQTRCVLLCPTKQALACDGHENPEKYQENYWLLESQQQLASPWPLSLHPSEAVFCANSLRSIKPRMKSYPMKRHFKKGSRPSLRQSQMSGWSHCLPPPQPRSPTDIESKAGQHYGQHFLKAENDWYMNEEKFAAAAYRDLVRKEARCPDRMSHSASGLASPGQLSPSHEIETPQKQESPAKQIKKSDPGMVEMKEAKQVGK